MPQSTAFVLFFCLAICAQAAAQPIPDTGQVACYNLTGPIQCPSHDDPFYGQDAHYIINPMFYTKLGMDGAEVIELPHDAEHVDEGGPWIMTRDNVTGLIWEIKRNKDGVAKYDDPHDADNIYTWYDPTIFPPESAGTPGDGTDTQDFLDALNKSKFGGFSDWRLPTVKELAYLVNYSKVPNTNAWGLAINEDYFPNLLGNEPAYLNDGEDRYWSATELSIDLYHFQYNAWHMFYRLPAWGGTAKDKKAPVMAVRGPKSFEPNYLYNKNGTITDNLTGLLWQKTVSSDSMNWEEALAYCEGLVLAEQDDWRMPNIKELLSLVDFERYDPAINRSYFPGNNLSRNFWSSTSDPRKPGDAGWAYSVDFAWGSISHQSRDGYIPVRCVRGGQTGYSGSLTVIIEPEGARDAGAQWRLQNTQTWRDSGYTLTDIPVGNHVVEFKAVPGLKPSGTINVVVMLNKTQTYSGFYLEGSKVVPGVLLLLLDGE